MIRRIEALRYRCLLDVGEDIGPFHVLVGPNASGKSTFLDVVELVGDLLRDGLPDALRTRAPGLHDLVWMGEGERFDLAVELEIPESRPTKALNGYRTARYELAIGNAPDGETAILGETLWLKPSELEPTPTRQLTLFPVDPTPRKSLVFPENKHTPPGWRKVVSKTESGNDYFNAETSNFKGPFRLGPRRLALANLPEDEKQFPVATWAKRVLMEGIDRLALSGDSLRKAAPPGSADTFKADGSNLPWVVESLKGSDPTRFAQWLAHVQTALPDIRDIDTVLRDDDKHRYLRVTYRSGPPMPSWVISDGTLRLLALTLLAYLDPPDRVFLIEEPENGIHPQAVECVFQALSSGTGAQVLCATHSPVMLSLADPKLLLCFARTENGTAAIVRGDRHPRLAEWRRGTDLGTLFASGALSGSMRTPATPSSLELECVDPPPSTANSRARCR
jgi:predicted ATPase